MDVSQDVTGTLRAEEHGHQPCVLEAAGFCTEHSADARSIGYEEERSPTLRAGVVPAAIALENHPADSRVKISEDGKVQTLTSRCGTGGGNVPMVMDAVENSVESPVKEVENSPAVTLKIRSGCEGGGKGAIWQEEKSATLGCNNDQTLFVPKCYGVCSKASHSMMSDNPHSGFYEAETSRTLDRSGGDPTCNQGGICVVEPVAFTQNQRDEIRDLGEKSAALAAEPGMKQQTFVAGFSAGAGAKAGGIGYNESVAPTLKGSPGGNCMPSVLCLNDQGGSVMECSENVSGTLRAQEHGHQPLVYENHGIDSRYTGPHKVVPTMSARYGTGGNNIPLVEQNAGAICIAGNIVDRQPQNGGNGLGCQENLAYTLTATDRHAVVELYQKTVGALCRGDEKGIGNQYVSQDKCIINASCSETHHLIRRLTPLECERLQGFPDGWTDIPGASDSARYKALGNSVAIPCVEFIMSRIAAAMRVA